MGASVVADTAFFAYDCTIANVMSLDPNDPEDKMKLENVMSRFLNIKPEKSMSAGLRRQFINYYQRLTFSKVTEGDSVGLQRG
ncbi:MAG: hypothetical protein R2827_16010 [Bdellovibrionales bacterium]